MDKHAALNVVKSTGVSARFNWQACTADSLVRIQHGQGCPRYTSAERLLVLTRSGPDRGFKAFGEMTLIAEA